MHISCCFCTSSLVSNASGLEGYRLVKFYCQNYRLYEKKLEVKVIDNSIPYKKIHWAHMSIYPQSVPRVLEKLLCLKYCIVRKRENRFVLGHYAAKNGDYMKKSLKRKLLNIQFLQKTQWVHMPISSPLPMELEGSKDCHV